MNERSGLTLTITQQKYLPHGAAEMQAMIRVRASVGDGELRGPRTASAAEVIIVDCSGSMGHPLTKLFAARRAARAALDAVRDGTEFAVVSGRHQATMVYPRKLGLVRATPETRAAAKRAIERLDAEGQTRISAWLALAAQLLRPQAGRIRHAMLFTDGHNWHESHQGALDDVLSACAGTLTCDARGIGDDWDPDDLRKIATVLHGTADGLADVADLEDDFRSVMLEAMRKVVPDVTLRIRPRRDVTIAELRQLHPADADLTEQGKTVDGTATEYWIGSWSGETRDYMVTLAAPADRFQQNTDVRLALVDVAVHGADGGDQAVLPEPRFVLAHWTPDPPEPTWLPTDSYAQQRETGLAIADGCRAWLSGQQDKAEETWARAVELATATGDDDRLSLLATLIEVLDPVTGTVRLRDGLTRADVLRAQVRSVTTTIAATGEALHAQHRELPWPPPDTEHKDAPRACPRCGRLSAANARFCEQCGRPFDPGDSGAAKEADQ
jgi:von Willebrand factor type A domain/von Willebrand factor type A C-terminal domain